MLRKLFTLALAASFAAPFLFGGTMTDSTAMARAQTIWGSRAMIGTMRKVADTYWTRQVGYIDAAGNFRVVGAGLMTWEAAFANVPEGYTPMPVFADPPPKPKDGLFVYVCNLPCFEGTIGRAPVIK